MKKGDRRHGDEIHSVRPCPCCQMGLEPIEPYEDYTGEDVECSRCWDNREICDTCEKWEAEL